MPRGGAVTLSDVREPTLAIMCEPCARRGRYSVERLIAEHGADAKLPDLLAKLANCEKAPSVSIHDRCSAHYERYYGGEPSGHTGGPWLAFGHDGAGKAAHGLP
jgi:hypothetical protein